MPTDERGAAEPVQGFGPTYYVARAHYLQRSHWIAKVCRLQDTEIAILKQAFDKSLGAGSDQHSARLGRGRQTVC